LIQFDITTDAIASEPAADTTVGLMTLDADMDEQHVGGVDDHNKLSIDDTRTLTSRGRMTLDSTSQGIVRSGAGTTPVTLMAESGITIDDHLSGTETSQTLHVDADSNDSGSGTFTLKSSKSITTNDGVLYITAADIQVLGTITTGTVAMHIHTTNQRTLGLGTTTEELSIEGTELQQLTATGLTIGRSTNNKDIKVVGITADNSNTINDVLTLLTEVNLSQIIFETTASTFNTMSAQADDGVLVKIDVNTDIGATDNGAMYLDGDSEQATDTFDRVGLTDGRTLTASTLLTLQVKTGTIIPEGTLTLKAGSGIVVLNSITTAVSG
jgi:hypothetical protein